MSSTHIEPNSIESILLARVMPLIKVEVERQVDGLTRQIAVRMTDTVVSANELANILDMSVASVLRKRKDGELPYSLVDGRYFFDLQEIYDDARNCNFKNTHKVKMSISKWIEAKVDHKLSKYKMD